MCFMSSSRIVQEILLVVKKMKEIVPEYKSRQSRFEVLDEK